MWLQNPVSFGIIPAFEKIDLPAFTVLTGLNGAGKSQLLRGIKAGQIKSEAHPHSYEPPQPAHNIVLLTNDEGDPSGLSTPRGTNVQDLVERGLSFQSPTEVIQRALQAQLEERRNIELKISEMTGKNLEDFEVSWVDFVNAASGLGNNRPLPSLPFEPTIFRADVVEAGSRLSQVLTSFHASPDSIAREGGASSAATPAHLLYWTKSQLARAMGWREAPLFGADIIATFKSYRDARWLNNVQRLNDEQDNTHQALSPEEFETKFGVPPWAKVTNALQAFGFPYSVATVPTDPKQYVGFSLVRDETGEVVPYGSLSTGEKILVRMVLASFQATDDGHNINLPALILLDELDASLHPGNVQRWLGAIRQGYVETLGIPCIITTHSPTTVALSPDDSIFEMKAEDARPKPIAKQKALDNLTAGLPMLSIDYSARRQVFVESQIDEVHFSMIHDIMRPLLDLPRTLSFVGTGTKGGCEFVYKMVGHMEANGNRSTFGIVDWDLSNKPAPRVYVLSDGTHYAKDNILIDPVLVGAFLIKTGEFQLLPDVRFLDLYNASPALLQIISDAVVDHVGLPAGASKEMSINRYFSGADVAVRKAYQQFNGHDIEKRVKSSFAMLDKRYQAEGSLGTALIKHVVRELPELCPSAFTEILYRIATADLP